MKLVELNGDEFLASISSLAERGYDALFSYKLNRHNRVIYYAIYFEGEVYYLDARDEDKLDPFLTSFTITDKLIRCNNIYLFDYKKLIKANKNFSRKEMIYKVQDVKMQLFNILGKESEFNSDHIKKITDIDYNFPISDFLQKNSGLKEDCCEIFPKKEIEDRMVVEIEILYKLYIILKDKYMGKYKEHDTILNKASISYGLIEREIIKLDSSKIDISNKRKYFNSTKNNTAKIKYYLDHSITGRTSSKFHSIRKDLRDSIVTKFDDDGFLASIDFSCWEIKVFLDLLNIEFEHNDIYSFFITPTHTRNDIKQELISYLYGSDKTDKYLESVFEDKLGLRSKAIKLKDNIRNNKYVSTFGKIVHYNSEAECKFKFVNGEIQATAQMYMFEFIFDVIQALDMMIKSNTHVIATIHDELILDCDGQVDIKEIINDVVRSNRYLNSSNVNFIPKIKVGKNFSEMEEI